MMPQALPKEQENRKQMIPRISNQHPCFISSLCQSTKLSKSNSVQGIMSILAS